MKRLLSTVLVLALSGCALMEPGPDPVAALDAAKLGLTGQDAAWPTTQWWQRYGDPQLDTLLDEALANNPSMSAAQARLARANAAVSSARAPLLPRVDANYSLTREHLSKDYIYPAPLGGSVVSDNRLALDFSYELDFWGKNRSRLKSAVSEQQAAAADAQAARNLLASATVRAYLNLQNAFAQREVLKRVLDQRAEVLSLTQGRYQAGLDTQVEVKQAESSLAAGKVELTQAETTIAQLRNQVAALAGAGPQRGQSLAPVALTAPAGGLPASVPLDLLGHRPDVAAAKWRAEAARHAIDSAKAEFYPNVNLVAFAGFQAMGTGNLLGADARMAGFGPAITLPIFHGGELNANLAGRRADADLAVSDYNQTVLDAVRQVADALDGLRLLDREKAEQRQAREAIDAAYDLAVKRYKAGMGNYISVLIAQTGVLTQARLDTDLRIRAYQLDASLANALGGGYVPATGSEPAANPIH
ncbi:efflux transporter outer membrane subunit [Achromobacter denitrificans]|jgi:NodT family efflux transporter outer membrane factor (OMF) lipoprotein|uniref:Efflux transporter outer membrane subunit n=5 Tax=Achromobacter denitrificans TaxID=32002 RepID=A0A427WXJ4_ACHDE|nr:MULTISPECIES: efflux transporter outer membrane subunit [Achromobacter]MBV2157513.1 efflux transporter outer membrane subunit [Achromobacter denitrificans]MDF3846467.1 efflux transporter outer membrane subunit [Achromobacter denitrificans]MDF3860380.1 efflux transporter outer membrane subunit [Achromobacter denitrificans]MDF3940646.1 efflux transporter outer membrane subunit [Achromobacter denitrificans]MDX3881547.1 efflux transporter outer membrane subunit [Achromobacter sp.]